VEPERVQAETGWDLKIAPDLTITPLPSQGDLSIIREYDPQGFWTR
jgi:glutaconate CoA-transferase, subunit B